MMGDLAFKEKDVGHLEVIKWKCLMANKTFIQKCSSQIKTGTIQETKLVEKLQLDLERDILRLFQNSLYCDIKLTVNTSFVSTHSCILKTRAYKFYKFIYAEFEVLKQNGISVFNFYNASFSHLQAFIQNIYTNIHTTKAEDSIIKHLKESKIDCTEKNIAGSSDTLQLNPISPDTDLFFTPKCSPSELQKPFAPSELKIKENNVVSYYKIVSVDDIPIDDKLEGSRIDESFEKIEEKLLEQELAEQDELLLSFKTIFVKKNKSKENCLSHSYSSQSTKKIKPKVCGNFESKIALYEKQEKGKNKLPLWKPNPSIQINNVCIKQSLGKANKKIQDYQRRNSKAQEKSGDFGANLEVENSLCNSDMDVSTTGCDSGLDNSSICQPETSPRENTMSETSGVDLTESTLNDEMPIDETISANQQGSTESSLSSEVGTWDANDDSKAKALLNDKVRSVESLTLSENINLISDNLENNDLVNKSNLNEEELSRLDEMERNIRDCELFLSTERNQSDSSQLYHLKYCGPNLNHSKPYESSINANIKDYLVNENREVYHYTNDVITMNEPEFQCKGNVDDYLNNDEEEKNYVIGNDEDDKNWSDDAISYENSNNNDCLGSEFFGNKETLQQIKPNDLTRNSEFEVFVSSDNDCSDINLKRGDIQETKTPPCTPKKLKAEKSVDNEEEINFPEVKSDINKWENNHSSGVNNYFIDASSLIDEDEIISPPISLLNFKSIQNYDNYEPEEKSNKLKTSKTVVSNFFYPRSNAVENENDVSLQEKEKHQGSIIFQNSIPHFSKHDVDENGIVNSERLRGGADHCTGDITEDENEQVVPSADLTVKYHDCAPRESLASMQDTSDSKFSVESHFFETHSPSETLELTEAENPIVENATKTFEAPPTSISNGNFTTNCQSTNFSLAHNRSPNFGRTNEFSPTPSEELGVSDEEENKRQLYRSQGEAWVVTFEDNKKPKNKPNTEKINKEENKIKSVKESEKDYISSQRFNPQMGRSEPSVEFFVDISEPKVVKTKETSSQQKAYAVEKSNSFGYFLDFGKEDTESSQIKLEKPETQTEKKNMFSMFIEIDDTNKPSIPKKSKQFAEKECSINETYDETSNNRTSEAEIKGEEDIKKSFYMFIESDSPNVKRKQIPKRPPKSSVESGIMDKAVKKTYMRSQSYTIEQRSEEQEESKPVIKSDYDCSSSDNSLLLFENDSKPPPSSKRKLLLPPKKFRGSEAINEPKITAWSETKSSKNGNISSESWLNTKDILVNYTGKNYDQNNELHLKKDLTFIMGECKNQCDDKPLTAVSSEKFENSKFPNMDRGSTLNQKNNECFVKLSDMDNSGNHKIKPATDRMSQSISETGSKKGVINKDNNLSRSIGNEMEKSSVVYVNRSLSRLFPNLSTHSLASLSRRDGDKERSSVQASEYSETSNSMQSSVEPSPLEISTSETDVSTHTGASTRLGEDLLKMFLEEIGPDVTVEVSGRRIKAHKCILSSRCQYFAAMLSGGWVESAGNVISLQGFSYNAVHFALRYIYSGESRIPESLNIVEIATLADMLCLDGLQEIISYNLKVKYCHSFHVPCSICSIGVIDCLPIAAAYGLDDLYRKCLKWITKYFVKLWPTKGFGSLPKELLDKCYQHYIVHMTVDNVLDTIVNIDKVRGSLTTVRWAESVSRLVKKLHDATIRYIAEHFSSVLTSDNFLALGKEDGWNVSRLEDSLIETIRYLPPEQACWSHTRLHRILSVANGPDPPPEMNWNENFLKLLQLIAELVENNLIKQAPRAAKSKAWRQLEPELRNRIQEAACLVLPDEDSNLTYRRPHYVRKNLVQPNVQQTAKSRILEIKQIKIAMSQQANRITSTSRPLSLQIDQRPKKDPRFVPLRPSASTSSVRRSEPVEGIRKTQSRSQILGSTTLEPKKTFNPRYSEIKSRYLDPRSPQKSAPEKPITNVTQRRNIKYISSSDSSRNCSPALRPSNSRISVPQGRKPPGSNQGRDSVIRSNSTATIDNKQDKSVLSTRSDTPSAKMLNRLTADENMSTDSLCTDSLKSDKEATLKRRPNESDARTNGKENLVRTLKPGSSVPVKSKFSTRSLHSENRPSVAAKTNTPQRFVIPTMKPSNNDAKSNPTKRFTPAKTSAANQPKKNSSRANASPSPRTISNRNQRNVAKSDSNLVNGNSSRSKIEVDSENNKKLTKESQTPSAVSRSGTFLKEEPTILKKPQVETTNGRL